MRAIGTLLIVCVALAVVKAAIAAMLLALVIALLWAVCLHPREAFGLLTYCAILGMISTHPVTSLAIVGLAVASGQFAKVFGIYQKP